MLAAVALRATLSAGNEWLIGSYLVVVYAFVPGMILAVIEQKRPAAFRRLAVWPVAALGAVLLALGTIAHVIPLAVAPDRRWRLLMGWLLQHRVPAARALAFLGGCPARPICGTGPAVRVWARRAGDRPRRRRRFVGPARAANFRLGASVADSEPSRPLRASRRRTSLRRSTCCRRPSARDRGVSSAPPAKEVAGSGRVSRKRARPAAARLRRPRRGGPADRCLPLPRDRADRQDRRLRDAFSYWAVNLADPYQELPAHSGRSSTRRLRPGSSRQPRRSRGRARPSGWRSCWRRRSGSGGWRGVEAPRMAATCSLSRRSRSSSITATSTSSSPLQSLLGSVTRRSGRSCC